MSKTTVLHDWDILERKSKTSDSTVFLVYRVVHKQGDRPRTEYLRNPGPATQHLRQRASTFRSRTAAERAIAKAGRSGRIELSPEQRAMLTTSITHALPGSSKP